jgi:hypothetical protein
MLYRSPSFRAKVLPLFGVPAAMIGLSLWDADPQGQRVLVGIALQFPAIYLPLLAAFLPHADQERSRWLFATSPPGEALPLARHAAAIALTTHVLVPVHAVGLAAMLAAGTNPLAALGLAVFSLATGVVAAVVALRGLPHLPFTDDDQSTAVDSGALFTFAAGFGLAGGGFAAVADRPWAAAIALATAGLAVWLLRRRPGDA